MTPASASDPSEAMTLPIRPAMMAVPEVNLPASFCFDEARNQFHEGLYDRYITVTANRYGGGATRVDDCQMLDQVVAQLARMPDGAVLNAVADAMIAHPQLDDFACLPGH